MLKRLSISNYALIDFLEIDLHNGLSIITGETGAGKSIILGALSLLLGQRADVKIIRDDRKKTVIEASFGIKDYALSSFFESNDIDMEPEDCILRREILPNGRSRAFINDTPVTLNVLSDLAIKLIDIHSQHSNALLMKPAYQLQMIDHLAANGRLREHYETVFRNYDKLKAELERTRRRIAKNKEDEEYFRFQLRQFTDLKLQADELVELENKRNRLANVSEIKENIWDAIRALGEDDNSVIQQLSYARNRILHLSGLYADADSTADRLDSTLIEIKDIYETLGRYAGDLRDDPLALEQIENRLNAIYALQQKYHVETEQELLDIQEKLQLSLAEIENADDEIQTLEQEVAVSLDEVRKKANELSEARKMAAKSFSSKLQQLAIPLGLKNLVCNIEFEKIPFERTGQDRIHFLVAFNKNQEPLPVEKTASGGEISRLMLCIKAIIAEKMQLPSIIFDEVDTGVSGDIANKIGEMMRNIADRIQVIAITHLPQVAALGKHHYKVFKQDTNDTTVTRISELDEAGRITEIAGMLSGSEIDMAAINNAKSLLKYKQE